MAAKWVFPEPASDRALELLDGFAEGTIELVAPALFAAEIANIAWKKSHLLGKITREEAREAVWLVLLAGVELFDVEPLAAQALELALAHGRSVYDCLYLALALQEKCDFVTADEKLVSALGPAFGCVVSL